MRGALLAFVVLTVAGCVQSEHPSGTTSSQGSSPAGASTPPSSPSTPAATAPKATGVGWHLAEGGVWVAEGTPPACPDPLVVATPVDLGLATAILYPGQVRGGAFKGHGGFRFDGAPDNNVTVRIPFDALLVRGSHGLRNGTDINSSTGLEEQDGFEFIAPCGVQFSFGHLRRLAPVFQAIADKLPVVQGFAQQQFFAIDPPVQVHAGDVLATAVGFEVSHNVFVDWGVLDLRHENGKTLRPAWSSHASEFDRYAVCWLDWLSPSEAARAHALPGGSQESGKESDYC